MLTRRRFMATGAIGMLSLGLPIHSAANDPPDLGTEQPNNFVNQAAEEAIELGLNFLARAQHPDGSFGTGPQHGNIAITSLCALALMAAGHQPGRGTYGKNVQDALAFVLSQEEEHRGYLHNRSAPAHGPMYSHGFGTLFLGEVHGMVYSPELRDRLRGVVKRATDLIIASQNAKGGWRYFPESKDADISVTACQVMALRSVRNAGISVPKETIDRSVDYVKRCQDPSGGFRYMDQVGGPAFARSAAALVALYSAGIYRDAALERGLKYLERFKPSSEAPRQEMHYFYGHYYAAQAMWTAGGRHWADWFPAVRDELIGPAHGHRPDGSWTDPICPHYATAMACIILQIPNNYLPIFQK